VVAAGGRRTARGICRRDRSMMDDLSRSLYSLSLLVSTRLALRTVEICEKSVRVDWNRFASAHRTIIFDPIRSGEGDYSHSVRDYWREYLGLHLVVSSWFLVSSSFSQFLRAFFVPEQNAHAFKILKPSVHAAQNN